VASQGAGDAVGVPAHATVVADMTQVRRYGEQATLAPADGQQPKVSAADAWVGYRDSGLFPTCEGDDLDLAFGLYTDLQTAKLDESGASRPANVDLPAWVVRCASRQVLPMGPDDGTKRTPSTLDAVVVVDAMTGAVVGGFTLDPAKPILTRSSGNRRTVGVALAPSLVESRR
jgi:hypothetical protein